MTTKSQKREARRRRANQYAKTKGEPTQINHDPTGAEQLEALFASHAATPEQIENLTLTDEEMAGLFDGKMPERKPPVDPDC